jgi:hypothetical protein
MRKPRNLDKVLGLDRLKAEVPPTKSALQVVDRIMEQAECTPELWNVVRRR